MTRDHWHLVTEIFHAALASDPSARQAVVIDTCKGDESLREDVEGLLAAHDQAGSFGNEAAFLPGMEVLACGSTLGPYRIEALVGTGGMGEVYRASDTRLGRTVAIKILSPQFGAPADVRTRFQREARAISQLTHSNICTLYDIGHENGVDFLVMEHLEGETLAARLERGRLRLEQVLRIGVEIAAALEHAHSRGIVHHDLNPGNVMLTKSGVKLLDFGLARLRPIAPTDAGPFQAPSASNTSKGDVLGTIPYMSPEELQGREADAQSDIWALGCVLYEMAARRRPFESSSHAGLIAAILDRDPKPLHRIQPVSPRALERAIRTCLEKDADDRWQSVTDLKRALEWIAFDCGAKARQNRPQRRFRRLAVAVVVGFAAFAAACSLGLPTSADRARTDT